MSLGGTAFRLALRAKGGVPLLAGPMRTMARPTLGTAPGRHLSSVSMWDLRPYATSDIATKLSSSMLVEPSQTSLSLLVASPTQVAQLASTMPVAVGGAYVAYLIGSKIASGGVFQHNYFAAFQYMVMSFMPQPVYQNMFADLMFTAFWLTAVYFGMSMFPEFILRDYAFAIFIASFVFPLLPLAFNFVPLAAPRAYLLL